MTRVVCVLRSGGEYTSEHVERLAKQIDAVRPGLKLHCLSDVPVPNRKCLVAGWPGWWSKMELFSPYVTGGLFYLDLDSSIVGCLDDMLCRPGPTIMRDVYRPDGLQSSIMYLPEKVRASIWDKWISNPQEWMQRFSIGGDQAFLETCDVEWRLWQDDLPGQVTSYKADVRQNGLAPEARVVVFHGKPRPWEVGW